LIVCRDISKIAAMMLLPRPRMLRWQNGSARAAEPLTVTIGKATGHAQGYILSATPAGIRIDADDEAGAFYARQTLAQLIRQSSDGAIPAMTIEDWPDFPVRGVMLDISRDKVPTMATLLSLIDLFAELKINQLQLYTEHTFAYAQYQRCGRTRRRSRPRRSASSTRTAVNGSSSSCRTRIRSATWSGG
jgi:hypothetical protein